MEPRIQYAKTSDGVSIAYWTMGSGAPLIVAPLYPWSHLHMEWENPLWRRAYERLSDRRMLIRYDCRGCGLSTPSVTELSVETYVTDLESVADHLTLRRFALFASVNLGPPAIAYAARHADRVSHLLLWCSFPRYPARAPQHEAAIALVDRDWRLYTETLAHVILGWEDPEQTRWFAKYIRASITPDTYKAAGRAASRADVTPLLPTVAAPTLVLQRRQAWPFVDEATRLASLIPGSQLAVLEGISTLPFAGDMEPLARAIEQFLADGDQGGPIVPDLPSGTAVILFADIAGSTALTERLGDAAFRERARELDAALRGVIRENGGTPIEGTLLGDGVLAVFTSARQAIEAALSCGKAGDDAGLPLHLGLHAGDVIREGNNVYGGAVNIAARVSALSAPGEVLVSETVRSLARTSAGVSFQDRGEHELKGVADPQRLFEVKGDA